MIISNCILNAAIENIKIGRNQTQAEFIISSLRRNNAEFKYLSLSASKFPPCLTELTLLKDTCFGH